MGQNLFVKVKKLLHNKKIVAGLTILLILFLLFGRKKPGKTYATQKVAKEKIEVTVSGSGSVRSENEVKVQFQTSGKLAWLGVKEGDVVKKWQALASLDKETLKKSLAKSMNLYLTNRWDFEQKQDDYRQIKESYLLTDEMKRILDEYQFSLNNAVLDVELADLTVKYATIYSPINGVVTEVNPNVAGINIVSTLAYIEVADPKKMEFEAVVDETDIAKLKVGQPTTVNLDAFADKEFEGNIKRISFKSITTSSGGTGFSVFISLPDKEMENFKIGLNGDFKAMIVSKQDVFVLPLDSILESDNKKYVFRLIKGKVVKTEVETGLSNEELVEITVGLKEGETVLVQDVSLLKDGQKVVAN